MEWLQAHAEALTVLCGAMAALWGLFARFDRIFIKHLSESFASKHDFDRLEKKVDSLLVDRKIDAARRKERARVVRQLHPRDDS